MTGLPDCIADILISLACGGVEELGDLVPIWSAGSGDVNNGEQELAVLVVIPVDRHGD